MTDIEKDHSCEKKAKKFISIITELYVLYEELPVKLKFYNLTVAALQQLGGQTML